MLTHTHTFLAALRFENGAFPPLLPQAPASLQRNRNLAEGPVSLGCRAWPGVPVRSSSPHLPGHQVEFMVVWAQGRGAVYTFPTFWTRIPLLPSLQRTQLGGARLLLPEPAPRIQPAPRFHPPLRLPPLGLMPFSCQFSEPPSL